VLLRLIGGPSAFFRSRLWVSWQRGWVRRDGRGYQLQSSNHSIVSGGYFPFNGSDEELAREAGWDQENPLLFRVVLVLGLGPCQVRAGINSVAMPLDLSGQAATFEVSVLAECTGHWRSWAFGDGQPTTYAMQEKHARSKWKIRRFFPPWHLSVWWGHWLHQVPPSKGTVQQSLKLHSLKLEIGFFILQEPSERLCGVDSVKRPESETMPYPRPNLPLLLARNAAVVCSKALLLAWLRLGRWGAKFFAAETLVWCAPGHSNVCIALTHADPLHVLFGWFWLV